MINYNIPVRESLERVAEIFLDEGELLEVLQFAEIGWTEPPPELQPEHSSWVVDVCRIFHGYDNHTWPGCRNSCGCYIMRASSRYHGRTNLYSDDSG